MLRLFMWNVNGIRAAQRKGFLDWLAAEQPDILIINETKASPDQLDDALLFPDGYKTYWASAKKKGYSGVALFTRHEPERVTIGLGIDEYDDEGRTITADYGDFVLVGAYFPNGGMKNERVPFKMSYKAVFLDHVERLRAEGRSVIFCGDVNTAHCPIDLARPEQNKNVTGFLPEERAWIDQVVERGYVDTFRTLNPDRAEAYTYWPYWGRSRERNVGWRIDYFFITPDLRDRVVNAGIHADVEGSDHCPVSLELAESEE